MLFLFQIMKVEWSRFKSNIKGTKKKKVLWKRKREKKVKARFTKINRKKIAKQHFTKIFINTFKIYLKKSIKKQEGKSKKWKNIQNTT